MSRCARSDQRRRWAAAALMSCLVGAASAARAYDPATTHAGLTERAITASALHQVLARRLGRPLGLHQPVRLDLDALPTTERATLRQRFAMLDPEGGYQPSAEGEAPAIAWVTAGAVLAQVPPERGQHHFLEPTTRRGLHDAPGLSGATHALRLAFDGGGGLRQLATGTAFDLTGKGALAWVRAPQNDLGLVAFDQHLEAAIVEATPAARDRALARALLALGGVLAALEEMGEPAHVRNDFRSAYLKNGGDERRSGGSAFEAFVAESHGRIGVPPAAAPVSRPNVESFFTARDGLGLADRTHRGYFSPGSLPPDVAVRPEMTPAEIAAAARDALPFPRPDFARLELRAPGRHYVRVEGRRALAYERGPRGLRFFLDDAVHADAAKALLPEIGAYAAGLVNHLLRGALAVTAEGRAVRVGIAEGAPAIDTASLRLLTEDAAGTRRTLVAPAAASSLRAGEAVTFEVPPEARRVVVIARGADAAGPILAFGETTLAR